jgi:hypothetical protein
MNFNSLSINPAVPLVRPYFLREPQEDYTGKATNGSRYVLRLSWFLLGLGHRQTILGVLISKYIEYNL